jgi:hypothetical protein
MHAVSACLHWTRLVVVPFLALILCETVSDAAESSSERPPGDPFEPVSPAFEPVVKQSFFVFGGRMSSTDIWSTAILNLNDPNGPIQNYDNYIVGAAYQRDFIKLGGAVFVGGEIGLADRFGRYSRCCTPVVTSPNVVHSPEFWGGLTLRYEAITVSDVRFSPGIVWGLSAITKPIGQEVDQAVDRGGSAKVLFYLGFEGAFSLVNFPDVELVFRLHHRSGAFGTIGAMKEGNNSNVVGLRYRF